MYALCLAMLYLVKLLHFEINMIFKYIILKLISKNYVLLTDPISWLLDIIVDFITAHSICTS